MMSVTILRIVAMRLVVIMSLEVALIMKKGEFGVGVVHYDVKSKEEYQKFHLGQRKLPELIFLS